MKKKNITIILVCSLFSLVTRGQEQYTIDKELYFNHNVVIPSIPSAFSYNGKPLLSITNEDKIEIFDDNFTLVKSLGSFCSTGASYVSSINYTRSVTGVEQTNDYVNGTYENITMENFIKRESMLGAGTYKMVTIDNVECLVYDKVGDAFTSGGSNYYASAYYGEAYPIMYFKPVDGNIERHIRVYKATYTDWVEDSKTTSEENLTPLTLVYNDLDQGKIASTLTATQTLFNTDDEFEYIVPSYIHKEDPIQIFGGTGYDYQSPSSGYTEDITTSKEVTTSTYTKGLSVYSSNGALLNTVLFSNEFLSQTTELGLITFGGINYIVVNGYKNIEDNQYQYASLFIQIDKSTSSAKCVKETNNYDVSVDSGNVIISNIPSGLNAMLYSTDGKLLDQEDSSASTVSLNSKSNSIVILKVGDQSLKLQMNK